MRDVNWGRLYACFYVYMVNSSSCKALPREMHLDNLWKDSLPNRWTRRIHVHHQLCPRSCITSQRIFSWLTSIHSNDIASIFAWSRLSLLDHGKNKVNGKTLQLMFNLTHIAISLNYLHMINQLTQVSNYKCASKWNKCSLWGCWCLPKDSICLISSPHCIKDISKNFRMGIKPSC